METHQLVYASVATVPFDDAGLQALLTAARVNNAKLGITGMLLYSRGNFLQVLEGEHDKVHRLFDHISTDPRHTQVLVLWEGHVTGRSFEQWSMGFVHGEESDLTTLQGDGDVFSPGIEQGAFRQKGDRARRLLMQFREGRWLRKVQA